MGDCGQSSLTKYRQSDKDGVVKCDRERESRNWTNKPPRREGDDKTDILISMFNPDSFPSWAASQVLSNNPYQHTLASEG